MQRMVWAVLIGFAAALIMAWRGKGLLPVAGVACAAVFAAELILI